MVRKRPRRVLYLWPRCSVEILAETRYGFDLSSASGALFYSIVFFFRRWCLVDKKEHNGTRIVIGLPQGAVVLLPMTPLSFPSFYFDESDDD